MYYIFKKYKFFVFKSFILTANLKHSTKLIHIREVQTAIRDNQHLLSQQWAPAPVHKPFL